MDKKSQSKGLWKRTFDDPNIIYTITSIIASIGTVVGAVVSYLLGIGPWWQILLTALALLSSFWALSMFFRQIRKLHNQLQAKQLPVYFVVERSAEDAQNDFADLKTTISDLTGFKDFNKIEGFESRWHCLMPYERRHLPPDAAKWKAFMLEGLQGIKSFTNAQTGDKIYHVAIHGPSTLGLALGVVFGTKHPLVFYQFSGGKYLPVLDLRRDPRLVKERLPAEYHYSYFDITYPEAYTKELAVVLGGSSHEAPAKVKGYLAERGLDMPMVVVKDNFRGNLTEEDWLPPVRELTSIIRNLSKTEGVAQLHLFYAMPVAFGFGLGMALGQFLRVKLYNFEPSESTYYPILDLNELEGYF